MRGQRVFHIGLAERRAGLAQHLAVEPQDRDLARVEAGRQHQAVEAVILDAARPDRDERLLEAAADRGGHRGRGNRAGEREFVHPDRGAVDGVDPERLLGDDAQPEILEHRQHIRQGDRLGAAIEPQPRAAAAGDRVQRDFERRAGQHPLDPRQVGDRLGRLGARLIGERIGVQPAQPDLRLVLAEFGLGRLLKPVDQLRPASASCRSSTATSTAGTAPRVVRMMNWMRASTESSRWV